MNKKDSIAAILCVAMLVVLFVCHVNLSANLRFNFELIHSLTTTRGPGMHQIENLDQFSCKHYVQFLFLLFFSFSFCMLASLGKDVLVVQIG